MKTTATASEEVTAMPAAPDPKRATESDLDAVLAKIDQDLARVHEKVKADKRKAESERIEKVNGHDPQPTKRLPAPPPERKRRPTPTRYFSPDKIKRTRQAFRQLSEDSLLTESGDDIKLPPPKRNGTSG